MKKIITKFWGVALIVMMLSSLFLVAAPAAATTALEWNLDVSMPAYVPATVYTQYPNTDVVDFAVSPDGMTIYAALKDRTPMATDNTILLKSTAGGGGPTWTDLTGATNRINFATIDSIDYVAISPDNPDIVVVLDATGTPRAAASTDGGNTFYDMGVITDGATPITTAYALDVSPVTANNIYYVAIAGTGGTDTPVIYYYNFGASVGSWHEAVTNFGNVAYPPTGAQPTWLAGTNIDSFRAVKFTPDGALLAVSENGTSLNLHLVSLASHQWDQTYLPGSGYPNATGTGAEVESATSAMTIRSVSIAVGPDFAGSESETQVAFIGASFTVSGTESGGIYRLDETQTQKEIKGNTGINSIDYDGTTVVAGAYMDNNVYRVTDPLSSSPSATSARSLKRIGIDDTSGASPDVTADKVIVHFAGETVLGAKSADASALSKSTDMGNTWNDFALMDSANTDIDDFYVSPDGSVKYQSSNDWNGTEGEASIYRVAAGATQRVLCVDQRPSAGALNLLIRGISSDMDVIYGYDEGGTDIYQTSDGGVTRWSRKTTYPGAAIGALAVESSSIIYGITGQLIYKSTSSGSSWAEGIDTGFAIYSLISLGEGKLVAGGTNTYTGWSTDSGATWSKNAPPILPGTGMNFIVQATGLTADDYIFCAPTAGADSIGASAKVMRAHPVPFTEYKSMNLPGYTGAASATMGLVLTNGILYIAGSSANTSMLHTMAPTAPTHTAAMWGTESFAASAMSAPVLRASATSSEIDIYAPMGTSIFYYIDIVSLPSAAPVLTGPADGALFKIVSTMLADSQLVNFTWTRSSSRITNYSLWISLDKDFTQLVTTPFQDVSSGAPSDIVSYVGARNAFQPGLTYYWKVNARVPFNGASSETRSFTIEPSAATVPDMLSPQSGGTVNTVSPVFTWSATTSATKYDFQLSELPGFETTVFTDQVTSAAEALPVTISLERGKTYFWRVRAAAPVQGDWSAVGTFTIAQLTTTTAAPPPVTITQTSITVPIPTPTTTVITQPPVVEKQIAPAYIWAIIIIGAILVIAVIVLIVRTRRSV